MTSSSNYDAREEPAVKHHRIAMVCDFFYPRFGGVENHIWSLSHSLLRLGHKVIVITHAYNCPDYSNDNPTSRRKKSKRTGVRYLPGGLKVYYCPLLPMTDEVCLPTFTVSLPLLRYIFIREGITIVHSHQATSALANEAITYASELGLASVYTDHSLFGFNDIASIILNRVLKVTMSTVGRVICVSHTCRDNFLLRAKVPQSIVHVIPNAVDTTKFTPQPSKRNNRTTVVVVSRLVYRKGVDLLIGIIPRICKIFPNVDFLIGGDGNKKLELEEMVHKECLEDRVNFLGFVPHSSVRDVLVRGHVFLNCSLTESFCIAILEAASTGLLVVSTNVGGVPEVLPPDMITLADPNIQSLVTGLSIVLSSENIYTVDPYELHERVKAMYSWERVAKETIRVYDELILEPRLSFLQRLARYKTVGGIAGYVVCLLSITQHFILRLVEWWQPQDVIDVVPDITCCETMKIIEDQQLIIDLEKYTKLEGN